MASNAASEAIFFIATLAIATAFIGVATGIVADFSSSAEQRGGRLAEQLRTDITIINDPADVDPLPLVLYVKNTGDATIYTTDVSVLVDGQIAASVSVDVLGSTDDETWVPGAVLELRVADLALASGDHRAKVVTGTGVDDTLEFRV